MWWTLHRWQRRQVRSPRWRKPVTGPDAAAPPIDLTPRDGISVVIPSRNGSELLAAPAAWTFRDLEGFADEVIVVDNGSDEPWDDPQVRVERQRAAALLRARRESRHPARPLSYVCLLNNDMVLEPGFFAPCTGLRPRARSLLRHRPNLFPPGVRREETGKADYGQDRARPISRCAATPIPGEDCS